MAVWCDLVHDSFQGQWWVCCTSMATNPWMRNTPFTHPGGLQGQLHPPPSSAMSSYVMLGLVCLLGRRWDAGECQVSRWDLRSSWLAAVCGGGVR